MQTLSHAANPFALLLDPQAILSAMDCSERLARLKRQVCRPLDKPLIPRFGNAAAAYDEQIDGEDELDS